MSRWRAKLASAREGDLKVWWIPQIPGKPFEVPVATITEGWKMCDVLADYDLFQLKHRIKPDYSNGGGVSRFEDGEWCDVDEDEEDGDGALFAKMETP